MDMMQRGPDAPILLIILGQMAGLASALLPTICAFIGLILALGMPQTTAGSLSFLMLLAAATAILQFSLVLLHEAGHAFAAHMGRYRVHIINVWTLCYAPGTRQFFRESAKERTGEYAGYVMATPSWGGFTARRDLLYCAGGVIATGCAALLFFVAGQSQLLTPALAIPLCALFAADVVMNLTPLRWPSGSMSDGYQMLAVLGGRKQSPDEWAKARLQMAQFETALVSGDEYHEIAQVPVGGPFDPAPHLAALQILAAFQRSEHEAARARIKQCEPIFTRAQFEALSSCVSRSRLAADDGDDAIILAAQHIANMAGK